MNDIDVQIQIASDGRKIYYVDVGNITVDQAKYSIEKVKASIKT